MSVMQTKSFGGIEMCREIEQCRVCGSDKLTSVLSLGNLAVSNFLNKPETESVLRAPLELVLCNSEQGGCGLLQLRHTVSNEAMYRNY
ncbi:MAG: hypothetical protein FJ333_11370, partial [Sphingomonadales bacterium]|nr:hypothetical protein [Sphingomonadales bacterium]